MVIEHFQGLFELLKSIGILGAIHGQSAENFSVQFAQKRANLDIEELEPRVKVSLFV